LNRILVTVSSGC